jgi:hypothetical protein
MLHRNLQHLAARRQRIFRRLHLAHRDARSFMNHIFALQLLEHGPVGFVLLLLGRQTVSVEVQKLRPKQPHPFRSGAQHQRCVPGHFNIR